MSCCLITQRPGSMSRLSRKRSQLSSKRRSFITPFRTSRSSNVASLQLSRCWNALSCSSPQHSVGRTEGGKPKRTKANVPFFCASLQISAVSCEDLRVFCENLHVPNARFFGIQDRTHHHNTKLRQGPRTRRFTKPFFLLNSEGYSLEKVGEFRLIEPFHP